MIVADVHVWHHKRKLNLKIRVSKIFSDVSLFCLNYGRKTSSSNLNNFVVAFLLRFEFFKIYLLAEVFKCTTFFIPVSHDLRFNVNLSLTTSDCIVSKYMENWYY